MQQETCWHLAINKSGTLMHLQELILYPPIVQEGMLNGSGLILTEMEYQELHPIGFLILALTHWLTLGK